MFSLFPAYVSLSLFPVLLYTFYRTRKSLEERVQEIGYQCTKNRKNLFWFWFTAPGVILHECAHIFVLLLFYPFRFRILRAMVFTPFVQKTSLKNVSYLQNRDATSFRLGEVQYIRPEHSRVGILGDGLAGIAPLLAGTGMFLFLYWLSTGYTFWETQSAFLRPGWSWYPLLVTPYCMLVVSAELVPSRQDILQAYPLCTLLFGVLLATGLLLLILYPAALLHVALTYVPLMVAHVCIILALLIALDVLFISLACVALPVIKFCLRCTALW